jgi:site-specific recombinase XerD
MKHMEQMSHMFEGYEEYKEYLQTAGKSSHTTRAYLQDLQAFAAWFRTSNGEDFSSRAVDPRDITEYRGYLLRKGSSSATVNRRLISLRRFFQWAHRQRLVEESPFDLLERVYVREQSQQEVAPRWLDSNEQLALLRAVRKGAHARAQANGISGSKDEDAGGDSSDGDDGHHISVSNAVRDLAVIQALLGTGLRISELANLRLEDVEVSERKGWVRVREGKGGKSRIVPLDNRTRSALLHYVEQRQKQIQLTEHTSELPPEQITGQRPGRQSPRRKSYSRGSSKRQLEGPLLMGQRGPLNERGIDYLVRKYAYQARLENCTAILSGIPSPRTWLTQARHSTRWLSCWDTRAWTPPECIPNQAAGILSGRSERPPVK